MELANLGPCQNSSACSARRGGHAEVRGPSRHWRQLHHNTTATFTVNGELSPEIPITRGIRQGCPLAPFLFLLGVEVLALAIKQDNTIRGVTLGTITHPVTHKVAGFVDDSAFFLQQASDLSRCVDILELFKEASGLRVQPKKCQGIWLNTAGGETEY